MSERLPRLFIVGGPDVHLRLDLMRRLSSDFAVSAAGSNPALAAAFTAHGFAYHHYRLSRRFNLATDLLGFRELYRLFRRHRPQIVHTFATKPSIWGRLAARRAGVPAIVGTLPGLGSLYIDNSPKTRLLRAVYEPLQRMACHSGHATIFQNEDDARQFIAEGIAPAGRCMVIPGSGVDVNAVARARVSDSRLARLREELGLGPDDLVVMMISRLIRSKGVLEFGAVARQVAATHKHVRFVLVGPNESPAANGLRPAELATLQQAVTWLGPRSDIVDLLALAEIFLFPSVYREGIPRVLLEAAAMGLPVVTTDAPGCREVVEDGVNGLLVPPGQPERLRLATERLIADPDLRRRFGTVSRQRAAQRFDLSVIADQLCAVYRGLLERPAAERAAAGIGRERARSRAS
jgi:glycosyltransferase involved in cell wall biosynthesis